MMLCNYFCCSLTLFPFCTLKGYLENTEKDRIRRLIRLKPPAEFWTKRFLVYTVYWRQWWSGLGQMIVSRNSTLKIFTYIVMFCCAFYVVMIRFEIFFIVSLWDESWLDQYLPSDSLIGKCHKILYRLT